MQDVKIAPEVLSFSTTRKEIFSHIEADWTNSAIMTIFYAVPIIGSVGKIFSWCGRCCESSDSLNSKAHFKLLGTGESSRKNQNDLVRQETRKRQANDLLYIVASAISLVAFSGFGFWAVGALFVALAPTILWSTCMILHAQQVYSESLKSRWF